LELQGELIIQYLLGQDIAFNLIIYFIKKAG
jgi:hypothetical protein